jgi:deoxyadenosine/deoxycytidine kinase
MMLNVPHTLNSTHVTPLKYVPVSSLHSQITTSDLAHTVALFSACFLTIHYESTININHLIYFDCDYYCLLNRVESERGSTVSGDEASASKE